MSLMFGIIEGPIPVLLWVGWLMIVNLLSLAFWKHREARVIFWAFFANAIFMSFLCEINGYNRLLGISHVIFWTPLLVYLFRRLPSIDLIVRFWQWGRVLRRIPIIDRSVGFWQWVGVLMVTNAASLVLDYIDVVRYILGEPT